MIVGKLSSVNELPIGDQRLAYEVHGRGEPVVAVRNISQQPESWPGQFIDQVTAAGYQLLAFQHLGPRNVSLTEIARDVGHAIDHLELASVRVWGYSGGAVLAQELVVARPDLIRSAIFMATTARQSALLQLSLRAFESLARKQPELADAFAYLTVITSMSPQLLANDDFVRSTVEAISPDTAYASPDAMNRWFHALGALDDRRSALATIAVPSMVIAFERDVMMLPAEGRRVAKAIPGCRYVEIPDAAHDGMWTHTEAVMNHVLDFFAST